LQASLAKTKPKTIFLFLKLVVAAFLVFFIIVLAAFHLAYRQRIYPGISAASFPIGNQTVEEAAASLQTQLARTPTDRLLLINGDQTWEIKLATLNFSYDPAATAQKAYRVGRSGHFLKDLQVKAQAWFSGLNLNLEYHLNQSLLEAQIATIAGQIFVPGIEPQIKIAHQKIEIEPGQPGRELDTRKLRSILALRLAYHDWRPIQLPLFHLSPALTKKEIETTRQRAQAFLNQKLVLTDQENRWELNDNELVSFLSFNQGFNSGKIASFAAQLASAINRPPQNAAFEFKNQRVTQFRPALAGRELDQGKTLQLIKAALKEIEEEKPKKPREKIITLPIKITPPAITIEEVNDLGIKELLGRGVSYFWGSIPARIHNLVLASSALNGVLIPPGAVFSFNETLGEVSPATGYQSAFIIKEGKTILGDGGGVCQVSTTLFRAALNAGLPIIERHPHSYRVNYYEQGGFGPGLDATVWIPGVDLKIKNDTPAYILIQARADTQKKVLTFELYGTGDGRQVTLSKPKIWAQTPPPPDLYQDDPTLPAGTIKRIEHAVWGAKVSVDWKVVRGEEVLQNRTFYSHYQPWRAVYLRGTAPQP